MRPFRQGFFFVFRPFLFTLSFALVISGCHKQTKTTLDAAGKSGREVILFTAHPATTVRPLLSDFVQKYGVNVRIISECADNGPQRLDLVARLILHARNRPAEKKAEADIFWSDEPTRAILLKRHGAAAPYLSPQILEIPSNFRDPAGYWVGFAARPSFTLFNRLQLRPEQAAAFPKSAPNVVPVVTAPLTGGAAATALAYAARNGFVELQTHYYALKNAGTVFYADEKQTRLALVGGSANWGVLLGEQGVEALSQAEGVLLVPDAAVLLSGAPNEFDARKLIDYLAGLEFAEALSRQLSENKRPRPEKAFNAKDEKKAEKAEKNIGTLLPPARIFPCKGALIPKSNEFRLERLKTQAVDWEKATGYRTTWEKFLLDEILR
jgi:iron(III) transport system substrate-binding protein